MNYLMLSIYTEEPVKLGIGGGQADSEDGLNYIPGSTIRGMFIHEYMKKNQMNELREEDYWILEDVFFGDGKIGDYIDGKLNQTMATPMVYYADKNELRKNGVHNLNIHTRLEDETASSEGEKIVGLGQYCFLKNKKGTCLLYPVRMIENLHIKIGKEIGEDSQMFRYEAIDKNQIFVSLIGYQEKDEEDIIGVLSKDDIFYLGGSKGSGYGKCRVLDCIKKDDIDVVTIFQRQNQCITLKQKNWKRQKQYFTVYAASNLILKSGFGGVASSIPDEILLNALGLASIKLEKAFTQTVMTNGYNHKWGGRLVQQSAVAAGSVFLYSFTGDWDLVRAKELEKRGIGERKQEGFGRIIVNLDMECQRININSPSVLKVPDSVDLNDEDEVIIKNMIDKIYKKRVQNEFRKIGVSLKNLDVTIHKINLCLSQSQIAALYNFLLSLKCNNQNSKIMNFVKKIRDKNNSTTKKAYEKSYIGDKSLLNYLEDMTNDSKFNPTIKILDIKKITVNKISSMELSEFEKKRLYLEKILYYYMREKV